MVEPMKITAKDNAAVKLYRKLSRLKKERMEQKLFVLEGQRLVEDAVRSGAKLTHLFCSEDGYSRWCASDVSVDLRETRVAVLSNELANDLSQTEHSQGVYAICEMPKIYTPEELLQEGKTFGILYQLQDPGNAGTILRTADAMGLDGLVYCESTDVFSPKVVRATMGSLFRVPLCICSDIQHVLEQCRKVGIETCAAVVDTDVEQIGKCKFAKSSSVLIGNEGNGLPREVSASCDRRVTIPMCGTIESLNAAMAAGIILWELKRGA